MAPAIPKRISLRHARRRWRRALVACAALVVVLLAGPGAGVAGAHAGVDAAEPTAGAVLERSPRAVKIWFTEAVDVSLGGVFLYDGSGNRIETGKLQKPSPEQLVLPIGRDLDDGSYIVTWRAVSEDTHPIQGTWTFQVGNASASASAVESIADGLLAGQRADRAVAVGWAIARWTVFASLALLVGGAVFAAVLWPRARDARVTRRIVSAGWIALTVSTVVGVLLFGAYSRGGSLADVLDLDVARDTLDTRFGQVWLLRLVLLAVAFVLLRVLFARRPATSAPLSPWWLPAAAVVGVGLVGTPGLAAHSSTGSYRSLALAADTVHVAAMAVWLGGLVILAAAVLPRESVGDLRTSVLRFSRVSLWCVGALIVTGVFQTWRVIGGLSAFRDDEYGRILVVKLVVFALLLVVASFSREIVGRALRTSPEPVVRAVRGGAIGLDDPTDSREVALGAPPEVTPRQQARELGRLRRSVWVEVALGALVLVVTALLVNAAPPDTSAAGPGGAGVTIQDPEVTVEISVTPGDSGLNDLYVDTYSPAGAPLDVDNVEMTIALPEREIAPLFVPLRELGPGRSFSPGLDIPLAGLWEVQATIRLGPVDRVDVSGDLRIR